MALARTRAKRKYNEANYYRIALTVPIRLKEPLKEYAEANGTTINKLLNDFIAEILSDTSTTIDSTSVSIDDTSTTINGTSVR